MQVLMPEMGESVAEGTVLEWHKREGDAVEADETVVEVSTDKVDAEVPAPAAGTVVRVLAAERCEVIAPTAQGCCGALSVHAGREEEALRFARRTIDTFEAADVEYVILNSAGCGSTMKEYDYLLRDDPEYAERAREFVRKVRDVNEFIQEMGPIATRHPLPVTVAYHDACHLAHGQGIRKQPRAGLAAIPGLQLREIRESEICCGSAGIYNLVEPQPAAELGQRKARHVLATGADLLVAANPGCTVQIAASLQRAGQDLPMAHPIEVIDASIRGESVQSLLRRKGLRQAG